MERTPLAVWSWQTSPDGKGWDPAVRLRALALSHAMAEEQGFRLRFYGDGPALAELSKVAWPWEVKELSSYNEAPAWFWSAGKLNALGDAVLTQPVGTTVLHVDIDSLITGPLRDLESRLYADHEETFDPVLTKFYNPAHLASALGCIPDWFDAWSEARKVAVCALMGGNDGSLILRFIMNAFRAAHLIDRNGRGSRRLTWFCEQGVFSATALKASCPVSYALNADCTGKGFAHWPGAAKVSMPLAIAKNWHRVPPRLRESLDAVLSPLPPAKQPKEFHHGT